MTSTLSGLAKGVLVAIGLAAGAGAAHANDIEEFFQGRNNPIVTVQDGSEYWRRDRRSAWRNGEFRNNIIERGPGWRENRREWRHNRREWRRNHWRGGDGWRRNYYGGGPGIYFQFDVEPRRPYIAPRRTYRASGLSRAHVAWCYDRYRSYRAYDNSFQPNHGPRRECYSPYL